MLLPKIFPITDTGISGLSHSEQTRRLILGGARFIQLREKTASSFDFYSAAEESIKTAKQTNTRILINDRIDIAIAVGADGVHLGQSDLHPVEARKLLGEQSIIGFSTHNLNQAIEAVKFPVDYIAIGPIFPTKTKENANHVVGIEGVRRVRSAIGEFPLVAIGGIKAENFQSVLDAGADSVATISGLLAKPDHIENTFRKLNLATDQ